MSPISALYSLTHILKRADPTGGLPAPYARPFVDDKASYWFDITILGVFALFVLAFLPRGLTRLFFGPNVFKGLLLRGGKVTHPRITRMSVYSHQEHAMSSDTVVVGMEDVMGMDMDMEMEMSDDSHSVHGVSDDDSHTLHENMGVPSLSMPAATDKPHLFKHSGSFFKHSGSLFKHHSGSSSFRPPFHFPSWSTIAYPIAQYSGKSVAMGVTYGQVFLVILYIGGIIFVSGYYANPFLSVRRSGSLAMSQLPVIFALGAKNNIPGSLVGLGYEKLNFYHRIVGITFLVLAHLHVLPYMYWWVFEGELAAQLRIPLNIWGIVSLIAFDILWLFSIAFFRHKAYNVFLFAHIVGITLGPIAACVHFPSISGPYTIVAAGIFGFDHIAQLIKSRISTATIRAIPELSLTQLEIQTVNKGWRAGQHVRLRVLSTQMGLVGSAEVHPFTIASASESETGAGLVLLIKKAGGWTNTLYGMASSATGTGDDEASGDNAVMPERKVKVIVEGPYGGLGHMLLSSYSAAILVAGGSGITFNLATAEELLQDIAKGKARTKFIEFVWTVQDRSSLIPLIPTLNFLINRAESLPGIVFRVHLYYTRALGLSSADDSSSLNLDDAKKRQPHISTTSINPFESLHPLVEIKPGRPKLMRILDSVVQRTTALGRGEGRPRGIAMGVCGPLALGEQVKRTAATVDAVNRKAVGGVEVHEEIFAW